MTLVCDQAVATASQAPSEGGMLQFDEGDVILVLSDANEVGVCTFSQHSRWSSWSLVSFYLWSGSHIGWVLQWILTS